MAISLNDHEQRIKDFDGKIVDLGNRITNLEKNPPKSYAIVTLKQVYFDGRYKLFEIPSEYRGSEWKWYLIKGNVKTRDYIEFTITGYGLSPYSRTKVDSLTYTKINSSQIKGECPGHSLNGEMDCTVLFYK